MRKPLEAATKSKISMFCHVSTEQVIGVHDVSSVYHVPLLLQSQGIVQFLQKRLNLPSIKLTKEMTRMWSSHHNPLCRSILQYRRSARKKADSPHKNQSATLSVMANRVGPAMVVEVAQCSTKAVL